MSDARAAKRRAVIEDILAAHLRKRGEAYLDDEDHDDDETPPWLGRQEEQALPASVLPTLAALRRRYDDEDCGGTYVVPMEDELGPWWLVRTRTDGDDGYAFAFDGSGRCDGAARTYLEVCGWDSLEATLALLASTAVPEALRKRPSLWLAFMREKARRSERA